MLYDSSASWSGMSNSSSSLDELPVAGEVRVFEYTLKEEDIGPRSGERNQITLDTHEGFVEAFRDTPPSFRVKATIDRFSPRRSGRPLFDEDIPAFADVVRRVAKVTSRSGPVPFGGSTCDLSLSPAATTGENCRALLTCGGKVLFGGGTVGFEKCVMEGGEPVSLVDPYPTPKDHDPELRLDLSAGTATLGDTLPGGAEYSVSFALAPK